MIICAPQLARLGAALAASVHLELVSDDDQMGAEVGRRHDGVAALAAPRVAFRRCNMDQVGDHILMRTWTILRPACTVVGLGIVLILGMVYFYKKGEGQLPVYTTASARMVDGAEIYRHEDAGAFTYPPFAAVPFMPFLAVPARLHTGLWFLVNAGILAYVVLRLRSLVSGWFAGNANQTRRRLFWIILVVLVARHLSSVVESKANDILILLLMFEAARFAALGRFTAMGAAAGIGAAVKATPWLFLPVLVWQKRLLPAAVLLGVAVVAHLIPDVVFPRSQGGSWTVSWYSTFLTDLSVGEPAESGGAWEAWNPLNQNIADTLYRLSTPFDAGSTHPYNINLWSLHGLALKIVTVFVQLTVLLLVLLATRRSHDFEHGTSGAADLRRFGEVGAVLCGMLLLSPMSSKSHFGVLIVPLSFCVVELLQDPRRAVIAVHLGLIFLVGTLTTKGMIGRDLGSQVLALGSVTWCTVLTLTATLYALRRPPLSVQLTAPALDCHTGPSRGEGVTPSFPRSPRDATSRPSMPPRE